MRAGAERIAATKTCVAHGPCGPKTPQRQDLEAAMSDIPENEPQAEAVEDLDTIQAATADDRATEATEASQELAEEV